MHDEGPGIPLHRPAALFDKFYRANATPNATGTGIGLAIAKGLVEAHGGDISVESSPERWNDLPLHVAARHGGGAISNREPGDARSGGVSGPVSGCS